MKDVIGNTVLGSDRPEEEYGEEIAKRLAEAGMPAVHKRFDKVIHGFIRMDRALPQSGKAISMIAGELRRIIM